MPNDIEIRVKVTDSSGAGLAAVNASIRDLKSRAREAGQALDGLAARSLAAAAGLQALDSAAQDASRSLRTLRGRAAAVDASLREMRDAASGSNSSLRTLSTRAQAADGRLEGLGERTRTLRADTDHLDRSLSSLGTTMGGLRGRLGTVSSSSSDAGGGLEGLTSAALALAPALLPIAASAVPIAANLGAAGGALAAFGVAVAGQIADVMKASEAEGKYADAVRLHGAASKEAASAQQAYLSQMADLDPHTRRAAAALSVLKDQYKEWSKSLAGDTMPVAVHSFAVFGALLPKLSPLVRGASTELDRLMTVLAGGVASGGFDHFMQTFEQFATGALQRGTDGLIHFMRVLQGGGGSAAGQNLREFLAYAKEVGPEVGDTLLNLSRALVHLVAAAGDTGVGMLTIVNVLAKLVDAVPSGALSGLLQMAIALKAVKLAAAGLGAGQSAIRGFVAQIIAARSAAGGASGGLASLGAAFGALSRTAKAAVVGTALGAVILALTALSKIGRTTPPDVDRLTTSLGKLGKSGVVSGEAARAFGKDLGGLAESLRIIARPDIDQGIKKWLGDLTGIEAPVISDAKEDIDGLDKALANLVRGGKADLASAALDRVMAAMRKKGLSGGELKKQLDDYKSSLADQAFEEKLAADAMGAFGDQAIAVQGKLAAQKASADGLRQSIEALNDANRSALGGMIGFEASIDAAAKAAKENAGSLHMVNGALDLNSPKAQAAAGALNDLASKTKDAATSARESGQSWEQVNAIYERGQAQFIKTARAMGLSGSEARQLASQIMRIPDSHSTQIKMRAEDAIAQLNEVIAKIKAAPNAKSVTVHALTKDAQGMLSDLGYKIKHLKNGQFQVTARTGTAMSGLAAVRALVAALKNKSITITTNRVTVFRTVQASGGSNQAAKNAYETYRSRGGQMPRYADGGNVQVAPEGLVRGPGSGTSDSILALFASGARGRISDTEFVVNAQATRKFLPLLEAINSGKFKGLPGFAAGGAVARARARAAALAKAEHEARNAAVGDLTITRFGQMAGYQHSEINNALARPESIGPLVSALNQWRGTIMKSTHGRQESSLLRMLDGYGRSLIKHERALDKVNGQLDKARTKLSDLKSAASQLSDSVKGGVLSAASIVKGGSSGDGPVSVKSVMGGLIASRDKSQAFAGALAGLKKKGLSKSLIQQIAEAGIDGGGLETAGALMRASKSEISSMNKFQGQISKYAGAAGKTSADAVYGASLKAAEKSVTGLQKSADKIEKAMSRAASAIERSIKRALGVRGRATGGIIGAAGGGPRSAWTLVGEQGPEVVDLPYGSRVRSNPDSRRMAAAGAGGGGSVVLELHSGGARLDDLLIEIIRKAVRVRGGDVQFVLGRA
ncbi:phage tail protein [Streptomyces sioyaensis]|uniref:phage tail protein n=1 Tax=Streptomyces sioyaensis TaxID=67364 RepID=UPI0037D306D6